MDPTLVQEHQLTTTKTSFSSLSAEGKAWRSAYIKGRGRNESLGWYLHLKLPNISSQRQKADNQELYTHLPRLPPGLAQPSYITSLPIWIVRPSLATTSFATTTWVAPTSFAPTSCATASFSNDSSDRTSHRTNFEKTTFWRASFSTVACEKKQETERLRRDS